MILTPDQRLRVFVSSTLGELAERARRGARGDRVAAARAGDVRDGRAPAPAARALPRLPRAVARVPRDLRAALRLGRADDGHLRARGRVPAQRRPAQARLRPRPRARARRAAHRACSTTSPRIRACGCASGRPPRSSPRSSPQDLADAARRVLRAGCRRAAGAGVGAVARHPDARRHRRSAAAPVPATSIVGRDADIEATAALLRRADVRLVTVTGMGGIGKSRLALEVAHRRAGRLPRRRGARAARRGARAGARHHLDREPAGHPARHHRAVDRRRRRRARRARRGAAAARQRRARARRRRRPRRAHRHLPRAHAARHQPQPAAARGRARLPARAARRRPGGGRRGVPHAGARPAMQACRPRPPVPPPYACSSTAPVPRGPASTSPPTPSSSPPWSSCAAGSTGCRSRSSSRPRGCGCMQPTQLLERLDGASTCRPSRLTDLPDRQRTLRSTLDWSHELLTPAERDLVAQLSTFVSGMSLSAVEQVARIDGDLLEALAALADHSLLDVDVSVVDAPRFTMLEVVREYAREKLDESGRTAEVDRAHAEWAMELARRAHDALPGPEHLGWLERLELEAGNIRAAGSRAYAVGDPVPLADDRLQRVAVAVGAPPHGRGAAVALARARLRREARHPHARACGVGDRGRGGRAGRQRGSAWRAWPRRARCSPRRTTPRAWRCAGSSRRRSRRSTATSTAR